MGFFGSPTLFRGDDMATAERMFDKDSFTDEITNAADARQCVDYLASNEHNFRKQLRAEGLGYDEVEAAVAEVWGNLAKSCQRVGYADNWVIHKVKQFGIKK